MSQSTVSLLLKISAVLWVIWGLVHMFAGVVTMGQETAGAVAGIADGADPALLTGPYNAATGAIINQHGFNLLWIGAFTTVGAFFIWRASVTGIIFTAIVGGITDVGYFVFIDLGGFANFVPGTVMTLVSASAVILSFAAYFGGMHGKDVIES